MLRLEGEKAVDAVISAYTDVCCENVIQVEIHWFVRVFPQATFPQKDPFHALKLVMEETSGASHGLHVSFCRGLRNCLLKWDKTSVDKALNIFMKDERDGKKLVHEVAKSNMLETARYTEGVMNYIKSDRSLVEKEALELFDNIRSKDLVLAKSAKGANWPYQRYIKKEVEGIQRGTEAHLNNFLVHLQKGCYEDPLPVTEMNVTSKVEPQNIGQLRMPLKLIRLQGSYQHL
jgi:hypothetical protein